jgi:Hydrazine synthase alpha subunit middle domain/WD40-like Beta Propeller Repeat
MLLAAPMLLAGGRGEPNRTTTAAAVSLQNPILFVTQVPVPADFTTIGSVFGNHRPEIESVARGGDLYILYPSGQLRNLTRGAGFGVATSFQGAGAIAVREPAVHWSGSKALFSMVIGAPSERYAEPPTFWQMYEVTGLGENQQAVITKVAKQPLGYNNISPVYSPDGRILFTSDRARGGEPHLYPQLDEYEEAPTVSGLWSLDPTSGDLDLLDHAPSGAFTPIVDSAGRVIYTRWDHLQRDQQADSDALEGDQYGTFDYADESAAAARLPRAEEIFPEPRSSRTDLLDGTKLLGHEFNHFFPWTVNPDGSEHETLNHIGRHELHGYFEQSSSGDEELIEFNAAQSGRLNADEILNFLQIAEDPRTPGRFFGVDAPEFRTHAAGGIVVLDAPVGRPADAIPLLAITDPVTREVQAEDAPPPPAPLGHFRDPLPLANGALVASHTSEMREDVNEGSREVPTTRYAFRLKTLRAAGQYWVADELVTPGFSGTFSWYDPDQMVTYSGPLWELDAVEVRSRPQPPLRGAVLEAPELAIFQQEGVDPAAFRVWLKQYDLAVAVSRDVTTRDQADRQQPFNLAVEDGGASTVGSSGPLYAVGYMQFFQADQIRGIGGITDPRAGRRVLARVLHDPSVHNPVVTGPAGSVEVAGDGSVAAFVPARRALTWHLTNEAGASVVKERYWLTFQPGEVRVCASCHGLNSRDQANQAVPQNPPEALRDLLRFWREQVGAGACPAAATRLCLQGGRFGVEVSWRDFQGNTGVGTATPLTTDTGTFWFFDSANLELAVKILDGRSLNSHFWVFYGALSSVEYTVTVTDWATGAVKTYQNASGAFASRADTSAFPAAAPLLAATQAPAVVRLPAIRTAAAGNCVATAKRLCLQDGRFAVEVAFADFQGNAGTGNIVTMTADTGAFWFFDAANVELLVKVLDGRGLNGKFWVFYGALSSVPYTITVTDTMTGAKKDYVNPSGQLASRGDTSAF